MLSGQDGSVYFKPAGTSVCLRDFSDFTAAAGITLPKCHGFIVGDVVQFKEEDGGHLDSAITDAIAKDADDVSKPFKIRGIGDNAGTPVINSLTKTTDSVNIIPEGNGGSGSSDNALPAHINLSLADFMVVCQVRSVSLDLSREELDTTALSCTTGSDANCDAPFRTTQSGYTTGSGTMEVMFTSDQASLANRLLASSLRKDQSGAEVKLYIDTVQGTGGVDDTQSMYISGPITLLGFSLNVTPGEVTTATVNFTFSGQPTIDLTST